MLNTVYKKWSIIHGICKRNFLVVIAGFGFPPCFDVLFQDVTETPKTRLQ
jgi:hypothetical protein